MIIYGLFGIIIPYDNGIMGLINPAVYQYFFWGSPR